MPTDNGQTTYCNARKRGNGDRLEKRDPAPEHAGDGYCKNPTQGGRCRMHSRDGGRPPKHALRSQLRDDLRAYVEQAASMDNPGALDGELAVLRGLLFDFLRRHDELDKEAIEAAHKLLAEIRKTSDTIHKQMTRERLTREEEQELFDTFATILRKYVDDDDRADALGELESAVGAGRASGTLESGR